MTMLSDHPLITKRLDHFILPDQGRLIAIDTGSKKIGLASSDPMRIIASPIRTFSFSQKKEALTIIKEHITSLQACGCVIGFPLFLDGHEGKACALAEEWAIRIALLFPSLPILLWDERLTSDEALEITKTNHQLSKKNRTQPIDHIAAALILKEVIEELRHYSSF